MVCLIGSGIAHRDIAATAFDSMARRQDSPKNEEENHNDDDDNVRVKMR
jgi:hypothetical protein